MLNNNIKELAKCLLNSYEEAYNIYAPEVDRIIKYKINDISYIERTLDYILGIYTDKGFYLFMKLLSYYKIVNLEGAKVYLEILKEDREEELKDYVKKL